LLSSRDYEPLIIAYRNGGPVHVSDVAEVAMTSRT
jgi:multidrug efflux pump subunit AcrB